jgi:hypothetical protein
MRPGETLSLTVTLPNEQCIKVPEAVVRWSREQEFAVENMVIERHAHVRLQHYVKRQVQQSAHVSQIHHRLHALFLCHAVPAWADGQAGVDVYKRGDCATALREWRPLAEQGYTDAQVSLGVLFANSQGGPQDYVQARQCYEKATAQGNPKARPTWGLCMAMERVFRKITAGLAMVSSGPKSRKCISANNTWYHVRAWVRRDAGFCSGP